MNVNVNAGEGPVVVSSDHRLKGVNVMVYVPVSVALNTILFCLFILIPLRDCNVTLGLLTEYVIKPSLQSFKNVIV